MQVGKQEPRQRDEEQAAQARQRRAAVDCPFQASDASCGCVRIYMGIMPWLTRFCVRADSSTRAQMEWMYLVHSQPGGLFLRFRRGGNRHRQGQSFFGTSAFARLWCVQQSLAHPRSRPLALAHRVARVDKKHTQGADQVESLGAEIRGGPALPLLWPRRAGETPEHAAWGILPVEARQFPTRPKRGGLPTGPCRHPTGAGGRFLVRCSGANRLCDARPSIAQAQASPRCSSAGEACPPF